MLTSTIRSYRPTHRERPGGHAFLPCKNVSGRRPIAVEVEGRVPIRRSSVTPKLFSAAAADAVNAAGLAIQSSTFSPAQTHAEAFHAKRGDEVFDYYPIWGLNRR